MTDARRRAWRPSTALTRAVWLPIVLMATGLAIGRVEFVLLGMPFAVSSVLALSESGRLGRTLARAEHPSPPKVSAVGPQTVNERDEVTLGITIEPSDAEIVTVVLPPPIQDQPSRTVAVVAPTDERRQIVCNTTALTWGIQQLARPDHMSAGPDGLYIDGPREGTPLTPRVLPGEPALMQTGPLPPRPSGMVGAHKTRRRGEGSELYDISPFQPGDRLRRIDWRVTARQAGPRDELYTRHTFVDADADVVCCLDNRFDLRADVATWGVQIDAAELHELPRSSVDIAVDTVASVAAAYLEHGDRVGVLDLSHPNDMAKMASGSRHLIRLRTHLARHTRRPGSGESARLPKRVPNLPPGAILVVTSVFMDDVVVDLIGSWRRAGHSVVAVDVLPALQPLPASDPDTRLALRIVMAERAERLTTLAARGVTVSAADPADLWLNLARTNRARQRSRI